MCIRDRGAVQAEDSIHHRIGNIMGNQCFGRSLRLTLARFQRRHVDIIIDMGVICSKMAADNLQRNIAVFRHDLKDAVFHKRYLPARIPPPADPTDVFIIIPNFYTYFNKYFTIFDIRFLITPISKFIL